MLVLYSLATHKTMPLSFCGARLAILRFLSDAKIPLRFAADISLVSRRLNSAKSKLKGSSELQKLVKVNRGFIRKLAQELRGESTNRKPGTIGRNDLHTRVE